MFRKENQASENHICLPVFEFSNSPISVDPLLHEVTNKVLTKAAEVIFWDSSKCSGVGNVTFPLNISKDTFINKTNTRLTPLTSVWFVLIFVLVIRDIKFSREGYKIRKIFAYQSTYLLNFENWCIGKLSKTGHNFSIKVI